MKSKLIALFAVTAMAATMVTVPMSAQAREVEGDIYFAPSNETEWRFQESDAAGSASVNNTPFNNVGETLNGTSIELSISDDYAITERPDKDPTWLPVQVKYGHNGSGVALTPGATYTISIDYKANITEVKNNSDQVNIVYATIRALNATSVVASVSDQTGLKANNGTLGENTNGTITSALTVPADAEAAHLEIQLYLRNAVGTVTFSDIKVTSDKDEIPIEAVASFTSGEQTRYFTDLAEAIKTAGNESTIDLHSDTTLSERVLLNNNKNGFGGIKTVTINGNGHTVTGPNNTLAFEVPANCKLNLNNVTVVGSNENTINVSGGDLTLNNCIIGSATQQQPGVRVGSATVNSNNSTIYSAMLAFGNQGTNTPKIVLDTTSVLAGNIAFQTTNNNIAPDASILPYTLVTDPNGKAKDCNATMNINGYTFSGGIISTAAPTPEPETITATTSYVGSYIGDEAEGEQSTAAAWTVTFASNNADSTTNFSTDKITWKLGDRSLTFNSSASNPTSITLNGTAGVVFGVIVNDVSYDGTPTETLSATVSIN